MASCLDLPVPTFPDEEATTRVADATAAAAPVIPALEEDYEDLIFYDEETRNFYTTFPDLRATLPRVLFEGGESADDRYTKRSEAITSLVIDATREPVVDSIKSVELDSPDSDPDSDTFVI